jgi:hypothetical protein
VPSNEPLLRFHDISFSPVARHFGSLSGGGDQRTTTYAPARRSAYDFHAFGRIALSKGIAGVSLAGL